MKANEVRIGNLIYDPIEIGGNVTTIKRIETDEDEYSGYLDHCNPIPLTEDWLVKFGFEYKECSRYGHKFIMPIADWGFIVENSFKKETWFFGHEYYDSGDDNLDFKSLTFCYNLKYVHQLQNIYFALTGEELTIK